MSKKRKQQEVEVQGDLNMAQFLANVHEHMTTSDNGYEDSKIVESYMCNLKYTPEEWEKYAIFYKDHYTRNLVATKDFTYDLILLCWQPNQKSAIHDHRDSGCWMRMLTGQLTEMRWKVAESKDESKDCENDFGLKEEHLVKLSERTYKAGDVFYINNTLGLHSVYNFSQEEPAISLHLYSPPIMDCEVWLENGPQIFKTSLHSIFGMRLPQHMFKPKPSNALGGKYWPLATHPRDRERTHVTTNGVHENANHKKQKIETPEVNDNSVEA